MLIAPKWLKLQTSNMFGLVYDVHVKYRHFVVGRA